MIEWSVFSILFFVFSAQAMMMLPAKQGYFWIAVFTLITGASFVHTDGLLEGILVIVYITNAKYQICKVLDFN